MEGARENEKGWLGGREGREEERRGERSTDPLTAACDLGAFLSLSLYLSYFSSSFRMAGLYSFHFCLLSFIFSLLILFCLFRSPFSLSLSHFNLSLLLVSCLSISLFLAVVVIILFCFVFPFFSPLISLFPILRPFSLPIPFRFLLTYLTLQFLIVHRTCLHQLSYPAIFVSRLVLPRFNYRTN